LLEDRLDIEGCGDGLVAVAVEAVVDISSAGHDAAAAAVAGWIRTMGNPL